MLRNRLNGTWRLLSFATRRSDGSTSYPFGPNPQGCFMFDAAGRYSVQLMNPDRSQDAAGYLASWGTYQVDEERQTFTLDFAGSVQRATVGQRTVRHVSFPGGPGRVAIFSTDPQPAGPMTEQMFITWEKISPRSEDDSFE